MKTILMLSLAAFALAVPVAQPQAVGELGAVGTSYLSQYAFRTSLIDSTFDSDLAGRGLLDGLLGGLIGSLTNIVDEALGGIINTAVSVEELGQSIVGEVQEIVGGALDGEIGRAHV